MNEKYYNPAIYQEHVKEQESKRFGKMKISTPRFAQFNGGKDDSDYAMKYAYNEVYGSWEELYEAMDELRLEIGKMFGLDRLAEWFIKKLDSHNRP
jgi:hypothetical protein